MPTARLTDSFFLLLPAADFFYLPATISETRDEDVGANLKDP